jgi:hypothetical protein
LFISGVSKISLIRTLWQYNCYIKTSLLLAFTSMPTRKTPQPSRPDENPASYARALWQESILRAVAAASEEEAIEIFEQWRRDSFHLIDAPFARES